MPKSHYTNLIRKNSNELTKLAKELLNRAGLPCDRKLSVNDLHALEQLFDCRIMVLVASFGNRICYKGRKTYPPKIYLYLVDDDNFHAITWLGGLQVWGCFLNQLHQGLQSPLLIPFQGQTSSCGRHLSLPFRKPKVADVHH